VIVFDTLAAPEKHRMFARKRKPRSAEPEPEPTPVSTTKVTLVGADPFADEAEAQRWHAEVDPEQAADTAIRVINEVLHIHRAAAADPYVYEIARERALVTRVGIGDGEAVVMGKWTAAVELPLNRARERRSAVLRPQERLAAILSGRDVALACEELVLRGRADLDAGRSREAALQLRVALEAAIAELAPWADRARMGERIAALTAERGVVGDAANAALQGGLDDDTVAEIERVLKLVETALRVRMQAELG
jgi:hypothetical protein